MAIPTTARPVVVAPAGERVAYLRAVLLWTLGALLLSAVTGIVSAGALYLSATAGAGFLLQPLPSAVVILGSFGIANYLARSMVFGRAKVLGLGLGAVFQGVAIGYLLLAAVLMGLRVGNPFGLVANALMLTGVTAAGMVAYVLSGPREFRLLGAGLSALGLPMLVLMGVSFAFPGLLGGTAGLLVSVLFVGVSAAGLLYQLNLVIHRLRTDQTVEGAYMITMGVLVLFWNILTLLMRLQRR